VRVVPSVLFVLPTMTQPEVSIVIAVESPTPPGQPGIWRGSVAKVVAFFVVGS